MLPEHEIKSTVHLLGLLALGFSLLAMSMKNILRLRILSAVANFIYIIYGFLLVAPPLIIGGTIAIVIHAYHIYRLSQKNDLDSFLPPP